MEKFYTNKSFEAGSADKIRPATITPAGGPRGSTTLSEIDADKTKCCWSIKSTPYWGYFIKVLKFLAHFIVVMLILFISALVFAELEDPESKTQKLEITNCKNNKSLEAQSSILCTFWQDLRKDFKLNVSRHQQDLLLKKFKEYFAAKNDEDKKIHYHNKHKHKDYVYMKWFYFAVVTTTTIGYGDVSPKTDNGKIFCIFFVVVGVVVMMTLLKSVGQIITHVTNKFHGLILKYVCRKKNLVSEELLSVITILLIFFGFLFLAIFLGGAKDSVDWSVIDLIYYWIITFTTVGYGDLTMPLGVEIKLIEEQIIFRLIGLAFLAAIIDAFTGYVEMRQNFLKERQKALLLRKDQSWGHGLTERFRPNNLE